MTHKWACSSGIHLAASTCRSASAAASGDIGTYIQANNHLGQEYFYLDV